MPSLVSALVNRMPLADSVVSVGEATLAFQIVSSVSAVDVRTSATVKLVPASAVATTRVAATAIGVPMVTMGIHGQVLRVAAGRACVQVVEEVATNMVTPVASIHVRAR